MFIYSTSIYIAWTFGVSLGSLFIKHRELAAAAEPAAQDSISSNLWLQTLGACFANGPPQAGMQKNRTHKMMAARSAAAAAL
jgi:hypothetical protein